ncbi:MAG: carboxylating nicotinate-nucleotide diphosphorylase [Ignavibacteriae bacterium]|nr:carboxylating nicotinate-nucleotide diphosphorylase [Ignavibacteriota bacterium]MCB9216939.1 carboxylating nicotinate-nucleotide diphosphorylase [Ignavibacteria bacterium]
MIPTIDDRSVLRLIQIALAEDIGTGDLTSESLVDPKTSVHCILLAKDQMVLAGSPIAGLVFGEVDRSILCDWKVSEGSIVESGTVLAHLHGPASSILTAERTALNFLQRMSGVASLTRRYVEKIEGTGATILDTRKTLPGWRLLDKYAVKTGGGENHRMGLYDMVMVKDNHIAAHGSIAGAVNAVLRYFEEHGITNVKIEVETASINQVQEALTCEGISRIMFDNFSTSDMEIGVALVDGRLETEASGGINLDSVRSVAETGVQYISVGALTHSAMAADISLDVRG